MRRQRGDVVVAEVNGEVVGVCQVIIFQHFQHAGAGAARSKACTCEAIAAVAHRAQMLLAAEELARERGCYRIQLTSRNVREALTGSTWPTATSDQSGLQEVL